MLYRATRGRPAALLAFGMTALLLASSGGATAQTGAYHDFDAMTSALRAAVDGSSSASMRALGTSAEGREIWLVEIAGDGDLDPAARPAVLVVGNLEGNHVVGSEIAVGIVQHLLSGADGTADVLANNTVYVVPRLNPDGAEAMFAAVQRHRAGNGRPVDDDNDGRTDEDPADDLNGDGVITMMRVEDPEGAYVADADDPRLMRRADAAKGESGQYSVYWEGTDDDGDSFYNEDGVWGVDLNRNFQHAYPYWQPDAGRHMVSESETRALMDFVVAQRNIAAILAFGLSDNLVTDYDGQGNPGGLAGLDLLQYATASNDDVHDVGVFRQGGGFGGGFGFFFGGGGGGGVPLRGAQVGRDNDPTSGRRPETTFHANDREYFAPLSEQYKALTGIESVGLNRGAEGAFFQFGYFHYGVPSFTTPGWAPSAPEAEEDASEGASSAGSGRAGMAGRAGMGRGGRGGSSSPGADAALLGKLDAAGIDAFVDWMPFEHPQLGTVEIGGFRPYATHNPPADQLADLGRGHGEFVAELAGRLPRVRLVATGVTNHGGDVFTVTADVVNEGYFPTSLRQGMTSRAVQATMVQIQVDPDDVLTGDAKSATVRRLEGSGGRASFSWVIRGQEGSDVEIRVRSQKGGTDSATVTLR
ncbi:MAG: hypothetical protein GKS06_14055 [Acidobacteria bacterium]|nr:hypothetical protein [Acidobacteriota bacterium]